MPQAAWPPLLETGGHASQPDLPAPHPDCSQRLLCLLFPGASPTPAGPCSSRSPEGVMPLSIARLSRLMSLAAEEHQQPDHMLASL